MRGRRFFSSSTFDSRIRESYDYTCLLQSTSGLQRLRQIHAQILTADLHQNTFLATNLASRYVDIGAPHITEARKVFESLQKRDAFIYNVIIRGYAAAGLPAEGLAIYAQMICSSTVRPNLYTFPFVLKACTASCELKLGRAVHAHLIKDGAGFDLFVNNALIAFYMKSAMVNIACIVFEKISDRDTVSWNSMISGYAQNGCAYEAMVMFRQMLPEITPDHATLTAVLPVCTSLNAIAEGRWIHAHVMKQSIKIDAAVGSGLIEMYASCGRLSAARNVFDSIIDKNLIVYTSMIKAFGMHGHASAAMEMFSKMLMIGIKPDSICFVSILSACSHAGLIDEATEIFYKMDSEHRVEKTQVHYACMVDLLARAGKLSTALEFIGRMPIEPGADVLGTLLGAFKAQKNIDLGEEFVNKLLLLDPDNAGRYAMLAKNYEDLRRWEDAAKVRKVMRDRGVRKPLGCSMVELNAKLHAFGVEDEAHPMSDLIYDALWMLQGMVDEEKLAVLG